MPSHPNAPTDQAVEYPLATPASIGQKTTGRMKANDNRIQKPRSWLELRAKEYSENVARWRFAKDFFTGDVVETGKIAKYLIRRTQGESTTAYRERCELADYTNHFAHIVDGFVGMLANVEDNATRVFLDEHGKGLGDTADRLTPIGRLWHAADTEGNGWLTLWKQLAAELCVTHIAWVLVSTMGPALEPVVQVLPATCVVNWRYDRMTKTLVEVVVEEEVDTRDSIEAEPGCVQQFVKYDLTGWTRYQLTKEGQVVALTGPENVGLYKFEDAARNPALPIYPVRLPMKRPVGWLTAKKCQAIFNQESARDHLIRVANFPKLNISGTAEDYKKIIQYLREGHNALHVPPGAEHAHGFIAPDTGPATVANDTLKQKVEHLYVTASREYGDAARERTATEVRQDVSAGAGAFLSLLAAGLDDAENGALWRIEQVLYPSNRGLWFIAKCARSNEYLPPDPDAVIKRMLERIWGAGKPVPTGIDTKVAAAVEFAKYEGLPFDPEQIKAAVIAESLLTAIATGFDVPFPSQVKADAVMALLTANGVIDAKTFESEQAKTDYLKLIREKVEELAEAQELAKRRASEGLGGPGGQKPDDEDDEDLAA